MINLLFYLEGFVSTGRSDFHKIRNMVTHHIMKGGFPTLDSFMDTNENGERLREIIRQDFVCDIFRQDALETFQICPPWADRNEWGKLFLNVLRNNRVMSIPPIDVKSFHDVAKVRTLLRGLKKIAFTKIDDNQFVYQSPMIASDQIINLLQYRPDCDPEIFKFVVSLLFVSWIKVKSLSNVPIL